MKKTLMLLAAATLAIGGCAHVGHMFGIGGTGAVRPAESEFGLGPRASQSGAYMATLQPDVALKVRKLQTVRVRITDASGSPVDGATVAIDGGMPEHGHGLPTRPKVTANPGDGVYVIEGVRFNMGGWWEFKVAVGSDTVTFNLDL